MKVGYVLKKFPRLSETFVLNEILALERQGIEVEIFSLKEPDDEPRHAALEELKAPVTVVRPLVRRNVFRTMETLWKEGGESDRRLFEHLRERLDPSDPWRAEALGFSLALAPLIQTRGINHLHAHFATIATAAAAETSLWTGIPYSFTMHAKDIYRRAVSYETLSNRMADSSFCVTVCEANASWLIEKCGSETCSALRVLYNGIDLSKWGFRDESPLSGFVLGIGRLVEKKGFDDFLRACAILKEKQDGFKSILVGEGEMAEPLRSLRRELDLEDTVEMTGPLPQEKVRELLQQAAVLVAPCVEGADGNRDALPTVLLEAMASGAPCISTAVGGVPEIISSDEVGWLIPSRSPEAVASTILEVCDNPNEATKRTRAARKHVESKFDLDRNVGTLTEWFLQSLEEPAPVSTTVAMGR